MSMRLCALYGCAETCMGSLAPVDGVSMCWLHRGYLKTMQGPFRGWSDAYLLRWKSDMRASQEAEALADDLEAEIAKIPAGQFN